MFNPCETHVQHPKEDIYHFVIPSTMKPTQVTSAPCGINQLPPWTEVKGDIRLTPFYDIDECVERMRDYIKKLNDSNNYKLNLLA